ncbi:MAG: DUF2905 domain-containing protein [Candidatus Omnitrophica bacterium]|nr:DUF2905 domain-containing protein [Candidatus Omnitrophota bacterium]
MKDAAKLFFIAGFVCIVLGIFLSFSSKIPWLGKLPGDLSIRKENFSFYFPVTTCLIISLILTVLFNFLGKR